MRFSGLGLLRLALTVLLVKLVLAVPAFATSNVPGTIAGMGYNAPASGLNAASCNACHSAIPEAAANATGPLAAILNADFTGAQLSTISAAALQTRIEASFTPKFGSGVASFSLNKSAGNGANVGSVPLTSLGGFAFRSGTLAGVPGTYTPSLTSSSATFGVSLSGSNAQVTLANATALRNQFGLLTFTITTAQAEGLFCKTASCNQKTVNVTLINNKPTLTTTNVPNAVSSTAVPINLVANDVDGDTITFSNLVNTNNLGTATAVNAGGQFTYTAPAGTDGTFAAPMSVDINDGSGAVTVNFTIRANAGSNAAPLANDQTFTVAEDTPFNGSLPATDTDALTFSPTGTTALPHGSIVVNANGTFTYTPKLNDTAGDTFTYTATDTFTISDTGTLTFTVGAVNDLPTVTAGVSETVSQVTNVAGTLTKNLNTMVTDPDTLPAGRTYAFVSVDNDRAGTVTIAPNGTLNFTARVNWAGAFNVAFTVTDAPGDPARLVTGLLRIQVLLNGKAGHDQPGGAAIAAVAGSLANRYTPYFPNSTSPQACLNCHQPGKVTELAPDCTTEYFTAYGAALCKVNPFDPDFATRLQLIASQFEPSVSTVQAQPIEILENAPVGSNVGNALTFAAGKNLDGQATTIVATRLASSSPADAATYFALGTDGQLKVAKSLIGVPQTLLTVYPQPVNDANQRSASGAPDPARQGGFYQPSGSGSTVTILVRRLAPVVADDAYQTNTDVTLPLDMNVTANDTAGGPIDSLVDVTQPAAGTVTVVGKTLRYVSDGVSTGTFTFTYKAQRNGVGVSQNAATVAITVYGANAAVAQPDGPYDIVIGETLTLPVQANDRGPKPFSGFAILPAPAPVRGTAVIAGDAISYTATSEGVDVFNYQVTAGGVTTQAPVTVRVGKVSGAVLEAGTNNPALKPVARALGDTCRDIGRAGQALTDEQADLTGICNALVDQASSVGAIDQALDQIRNEETLVAGNNAQEHDRASANNIFGRLDAIRDGKGRGLNFSQFGLKVDNVNISGALIDAVIHKASDDDPSASKVDLPWGVFLAGTVSYATKGDSLREAGFDISGLMLTAGADYKINDKALIGLAISGGQLITDIGGGSTLSSRSFQLAGYGAFELTSNLFLDGYAGISKNDYDMSRNINFTSGPSSVNRSALSNFDGETLSAAARVKYVTQLGEADLETYLTANYLKVWTDSYVENGAGGLNLVVGKQDFQTLAGTVGMRISQPFDFEMGRIKPYFGLSYSRQLLSDKRNVASRFAAGLPGSPSFLVSGGGDGQNFGTVELGLQADFIDHSSATFDVSGTFSDGGFAGYQAKLGVDIPLGYVPPPAAEPQAPVVKKRRTAPKVTAAKPSRPVAPKRPAGATKPVSGSGAGDGSAGGSAGAGGWGG